MKRALLIVIIALNFLSCSSQPSNSSVPGMSAKANEFLRTLSDRQKANTRFAFDAAERHNWHYIPKGRKGISLGDLDKTQRTAAFDLLRTALSDTGYNKTIAIIELEAVLRDVEGRPANDPYRDPAKYYFSVFGNPATDAIWGWRLEGHHISFNFSTKNNKLISGTPGFLGAHPAVILSGPDKGKQILKDETELGFTLLHSLDEVQRKKAIISSEAPAEIITDASRKAIISDSGGISYGELNAAQKRYFLQLLSVYIHRYTRLFATAMMQDIENAGLNNLRFAWAGSGVAGLGHPHYYRIHGPAIIIEYDNTQHNANHIHTVIRHQSNDFGEDELLEHYKNAHH